MYSLCSNSMSVDFIHHLLLVLNISGIEPGHGGRELYIVRPTPNGIDIPSWVPGRRWRHIFVAGVVAAHLSFPRTDTTVWSISIVAVVHNHGESLLHICFVFRDIDPSLVLASLEVGPQSVADALKQVRENILEELKSQYRGNKRGEISQN